MVRRHLGDKLGDKRETLGAAMGKNYTTGSVRKHGGKWQAVISYRDETGKVCKVAKSTGVDCDGKSNRGKATAEDFLRRWRDQLVRDEEKRLTLGSTSTLMEHVDSFITTREGNKKVEETTLATYRTHRARLLGSPLANNPSFVGSIG